MPKKLKPGKLYTYKCKLCKHRFKDTIDRFNNDDRECPRCHNMAVILKHGYTAAPFWYRSW